MIPFPLPFTYFNKLSFILHTNHTNNEKGSTTGSRQAGWCRLLCAWKSELHNNNVANSSALSLSLSLMNANESTCYSFLLVCYIDNNDDDDPN